MASIPQLRLHFPPPSEKDIKLRDELELSGVACGEQVGPPLCPLHRAHEERHRESWYHRINLQGRKMLCTLNINLSMFRFTIFILGNKANDIFTLRMA